MEVFFTHKAADRLVWDLIASAGFQLWSIPTCLGLKGFVIVVVVVKRQTDVAMLLSHEDSVLVLLFLIVRDVPKI